MAALELSLPAAPPARTKTEKLRVLTLKTPFVRKTDPLYVETCAFSHAPRRVFPERPRHEAVTETAPPPPPAVAAAEGPAAFLAHITRRQVRAAVLYLEGWTQAEIAAELEITQQTVSRELQHVRRAACRFGGSLPKPRQLVAACEVQTSERLYKSL